MLLNIVIHPKTLSDMSNLWPMGHMYPRIAVNTASNYLKHCGICLLFFFFGTQLCES